MDPEHAEARLSIWRDFTPAVRLALQDEEAGWRTVTRDSRLLEEVYVLPFRDPFGSISDDDVRTDLREALYDRLDVSLAPARRSIAVLGEFVEKAERAINEGHAEPLPSDSASAADATRTPTEPNPLLALVLHFKWLVRCFGDRPSVSVLVR